MGKVTVINPNPCGREIESPEEWFFKTGIAGLGIRLNPPV